MKFAVRIYGEVEGFTPEKLEELQKTDLYPFEVRDGRVEVEHEGEPMDIEPKVEAIATALGEKGSGYVDYIDNDEWVVWRYQLSPGHWQCTEVNPDHALEGYGHLK